MEKRSQCDGFLVRIDNLIDDAKCFETVRHIRWPDGTWCPSCGSSEVIRFGHDQTQPARQRYHCKRCRSYFDDLTGTIFEGHHQPLRIWILCLYLMGLNLSNQQIAAELDLNKDDVQNMTKALRSGVNAKKPSLQLTGEVECDEVYIVAGHKGHPEVVKKRAQRATKPPQKRPRPWYPGEGKASPLRHHPAVGSSDDQNA